MHHRTFGIILNAKHIIWFYTIDTGCTTFFVIGSFKEGFTVLYVDSDGLTEEEGSREYTQVTTAVFFRIYMTDQFV
jgi:hypothetical protein